MLKEYRNKYKEIYKQENNENKYYISYTATEIETNNLVFLKYYDKNLIDEGPKDFLLKQIQREEKLTKLCESQNVI